VRQPEGFLEAFALAQLGFGCGFEPVSSSGAYRRVFVKHPGLPTGIILGQLHTDGLRVVPTESWFPIGGVCIFTLQSLRADNRI
jgi:hypothetical protein